MVEQVKTTITSDVFRQLPETSEPTELINGVITVAPSPISKHQRLVGRIYALLLQVSSQGEPMIAPMDVYLDDLNVFQPDVFWCAEDSQCVERDGYFYGAPELVVEVHSPATAKNDKQTKFDHYQQHGVIEYWMVDPVGNLIEVWQRVDDSFKRLGVYSEGETFASLALHKNIVLNGIFPTTSA